VEIMSGTPATRRSGEARPTIYDVARMARVSTATVSKVLRGVASVGADNARRVTEAVRELGYRSDPLAANLRRNRRSLVGLVVPDFRNPFFGALVAAIEHLAEGSGHRLVAVSTSESADKEDQQITALLDWRVGGLILIPSGHGPRSIARLNREAIPAVVLDRVPLRPACDGVGVDNAEAAGEMVRRFYALGHRHLLVAATTPNYPNMAERLDGLRAAAAAMPEAMEVEVMFCGTDLDSAGRAFARRFADNNLPTAIFALFNLGTLAALREISRRDMTIPDDISIAGFDDFEWMQVMHPPVASVVQPVDELARTAWDRLLHRMENPGDKPHRIRLTCRVEQRGSIAALDTA
jgi:LacI family transcriptional regulator